MLYKISPHPTTHPQPFVRNDMIYILLVKIKGFLLILSVLFTIIGSSPITLWLMKLLAN